MAVKSHDILILSLTYSHTEKGERKEKESMDMRDKT